MERKTLEINVISANDINDVNLVSKMDVYVVVSLIGGPTKQKFKTAVAKNCGTNPTWSFPIKFTVDDAALQQDRLTLVFKLRSQRTLGDKDVGDVTVPVKEFLQGGGGEVQFLSYQVRTPSGKAKGMLNFSYRFGAESDAAPYKGGGGVVHAPAYLAGGDAAYKGGGEPVTAYPAVGPSGVYPPPATGYGYPPPQAAGYNGYPPPPYGGYNGYPPPHPQAGYGYPPPPAVQQPAKKKNKFGMGLGAGLLGGALGGLLIGDMVSDMGGYDGGFDGGDMGGFDF